MRSLWKRIKGWSAILDAKRKKNKRKIMKELVGMMDPIWKVEEIRAKQKSRERKIKDGITPEENLLLEGELTEEEIKRAIDSSYSEGATGPDEFSFMFYQKFWEIIKGDLIPLVK
jgi:hypothetical protein